MTYLDACDTAILVVIIVWAAMDRLSIYIRKDRS